MAGTTSNWSLPVDQQGLNYPQKKMEPWFETCNFSMWDWSENFARESLKSKLRLGRIMLWGIDFSSSLLFAVISIDHREVSYCSWLDFKALFWLWNIPLSCLLKPDIFRVTHLVSWLDILGGRLNNDCLKNIQADRETLVEEGVLGLIRLL